MTLEQPTEAPATWFCVEGDVLEPVHENDQRPVGDVISGVDNHVRSFGVTHAQRGYVGHGQYMAGIVQYQFDVIGGDSVPAG